MTTWHKMDIAPNDGRPFLVQFLPYSIPCLCMRKVIFEVNGEGRITMRDCGAWLHVHGIDDEWQHGPTTGEPRWALAPDNLNNTAAWRWCEIPEAPTEILDEIRADLTKAA